MALARIEVNESLGNRRVLFGFQAEDGIRVHCVTGVQTCALPISSRCDAHRGAPPCSDTGNDLVDDFVAVITSMAVRLYGRRNAKQRAAQIQACVKRCVRSEERRVGKEWRSRWSPYT